MMNWILGLVVIIILGIMIVNYRAKKKRQRTFQNLRDNWGKSKSEEFFNFYYIQKYFENTRKFQEAYHIISDRCAKDLDLDEVFKVIDRTSSKVGQQYLYYKIRTIQDKDSLAEFDALTQLFAQDKELRLKTQFQLSQINSNASYHFEELVNSEPIPKPKFIGLIYTLSFLSLIFIGLGFLFPIFYLFLIPVVATNMAFHYKNKWNVSTYLDGVVQMTKVLQVSKTIAGYSKVKNKFPETSFIKNVEKIKLKTKFISFEKNIDHEFASVIWLLIEFIKILFNVEYIVFYSFVDSIRDMQEELRKMFHFIGDIDAAISTASLKVSNFTCCTPTFTTSKNLTIKEITHPLIENCIPNNLNPVNSSLLLTGSNMSGKTTFIRSVGINSILAQTLNICFAKEFATPFFKLYSSIRIADDVLENTSYYLKEVLTLQEFITSSKDPEPCLFILDEIFKGTNTIERIAGGKVILSYLNNENNMVLVSTHDIELTDFLQKEKFDLYHFSEHIENNELSFDHQLKGGKLKTRNAIKILELYNYPSQITEDARTTEKKIASTQNPTSPI